MKNNVRKALAISGLAIAIGTSGIVLDASANTGSSGIHRSSQERILRSKRMERNLAGRHAISGTVTEISGDNITITRGSKTYTVTTSSTTKFINLKWKTIALSDIKKGDKIRVFGTLSDTTITAKTVRDISLD